MVRPRDDRGPELPQLRPPEEMPESYYNAYCAAGNMRLSTRAAARTWFALGVGAEVAGAWARHGFPPDQGWQLMNRDITPELAAPLYTEAPPRK